MKTMYEFHIRCSEGLRKDVMGAKEVCDDSQEYAVMINVKMRDRWNFGKSGCRKVCTIMLRKRLSRKEHRNKYEKVGEIR